MENQAGDTRHRQARLSLDPESDILEAALMDNPFLAFIFWLISTFALVAAPPAALAQQSAGAPKAQDARKQLYKTAYRVIDVHTHFFWPDEEMMKLGLEAMAREGVAAAVNLDGGRTDGTLPAWIKLQKKFPSRTAIFAKFTKKDFARVQEPGFFDDLVRELEGAAKMGIQGIKI